MLTIAPDPLRSIVSVDYYGSPCRIADIAATRRRAYVKDLNSRGRRPPQQGKYATRRGYRHLYALFKAAVDAAESSPASSIFCGVGPPFCVRA
jgi:hypothetical protein